LEKIIVYLEESGEILATYWQHIFNESSKR
jgi:hypothetical protein